ncbi:MAG: hypothetical protein R3C11_25110 [Planctomycetaceae bacterium]
MSEEQFDETDEEGFEEISSDEVDRIVGSLESLAESVESENIRSYLEEAIHNIYYLVYDDEDLEDDVADAA